MKEALRRKLDTLIEEEQKSPIDQELLTKLHEFASGATLYERFTPEVRNTLNEFFSEVRNSLFEQILAGKYGPQVIIDAFIVLTFETGYKLAEERSPSPP